MTRSIEMPDPHNKKTAETTTTITMIKIEISDKQSREEMNAPGATPNPPLTETLTLWT